MGLENVGDHRDAAPARHVDVDQDDARCELADLGDGVVYIGCGPDDREVLAEFSLNSREKQLVVVYEKQGCVSHGYLGGG